MLTGIFVLGFKWPRILVLRDICSGIAMDTLSQFQRSLHFMYDSRGNAGFFLRRTLRCNVTVDSGFFPNRALSFFKICSTCSWFDCTVRDLTSAAD